MQRIRNWARASRGAMAGLLARLRDDERGGEVLEYVFVALLISVAVIAVIAGVGTKVLARWTSINATL